MRVIKSLLLGAAAGLAATAGVQAADMPVKAKAVEYVKICSAYGAGFYYIPGSDICLRVGGAVRADYYHNAPGAFPDINSGNTRSEETHVLRGRGYIILDARNNTPYGTLRAYLNIYQSFTTSSAGLGASEGTNADRAFIQFAGFTFGRAASFYDFFGSAGPQANLVNWGGQGTGASGWNVLAYTAQLGNGLSASLSMEDQRRKPVLTAAGLAANITAGTALTNFRAGQNMPAFTANIRVDQAWGSAQLMAAVQELRSTEAGPAISTYGYAVGGGFTWNNPSAPGSQFGIQASWSKGAGGYVQTGSITSTHLIMDGAPVVASGSTGTIADGVVVGTAIEKTTVWGVNAGYQHRFSPQWAATLHGGYTSVGYNSTVEAAVGAGFTLDYDVWSLGTRLLWTPVAGLDFGLDILYHNFESQSDAAGTFGGGLTAKDNDVWAAMFRVQRNF